MPQQDTIRGQCLCGGVQFEVRDPPRRIYQCHCSLCRKQSGAGSNAAFIVRGEQLTWLKGQELVSSYVKPTGFRSDFCRTCGSPVPNPLRSTSYVWVPVGLFDEPTTLSIAMHLYVGSKASWEPAPSAGTLHEEMPDFRELWKGLHS